MKKIDRVVAFELDGKVTMRLYTGINYVDAEVAPENLYLIVASLAELAHTIQQRR